MQNLISAEIWKPVCNFEGYYEISNWGRVKSLFRIVKGRYYYKKKQCFLKPKSHPKGYQFVEFSVNGIKKSVTIHRLVAEAFLSSTQSLSQEINHKDGNKLNNYVSNLEWCTHLSNMQHAVETKLKDHKRGKHFNAVKVVDANSKIIYDCLTDAAEANGISKNLLSMYLNNKRKNKTSLQFLKSKN